MSEADPALPFQPDEENTDTPVRVVPVEDNRVRIRPSDRKMRKKQREKIAQRVVSFYEEDESERTNDRVRRLNLYAKIRGWQEEDDGLPWPGSSNVALPDISRSCEETQDTLVNAALSTRPTIMAKAMNKRAVNRERKLSQMLDVQFYEEQRGESVMHELAQTFTEDGCFVAFVPWVDEERRVCEKALFDPIPDREIPRTYLKQLLNQRFPSAEWEQFARDEEGWSWKVRKADDPDDSRMVEFYTQDELPDDAYGKSENVEMIVEYSGCVFEGPKVIVKDYDDVLHPARAANLQIPGPSNPGGATHVILRDFPTYDEIVRLQKDGTYDLISAKDLEEMKSRGGSRDVNYTDEKRQKDTMAGTIKQKDEEDPSHRDFTRLTCFDIYDFEDGNGAVDVVWTVLLEPQMLCRMAELTELYPVPDGERPMRPLAESSYLPVKGRRVGRSLPELMEGLHDFNKSIFDQLRDLGDMAMTPFFFYQPSSSTNPEITSVAPGEGYPLDDPKSVFFPTINVQGGAFGLNLLTVATQMQEKLTVLGDLRQGRVPSGSSAALRTSGNLQSLLAQGEARPERVLRRFFMGVTDIFRLMHRLNQFYLGKEKQFRVGGMLEPDEDPYQAVTREEISDSRFDFMFVPNVQNASLTAKQESLQQTATVLLNPLALQMGLMQPDGVFRLTRDLARTYGHDVDQYLTAPTPESTRPRITAAGALERIMHSEIPMGAPMEGAEEHFATINKLLDTQVRTEEGTTTTARTFFTGAKAAILADYMRQVSQRIQQEKQQSQQIAAAKQLARERQQRQPGRPAEPGGIQPPTGPPAVQGGELIDETLPGAGGGAK